MEQKHRREKKMCPIHYGRKTRKERERHKERERDGDTEKETGQRHLEKHRESKR